MKNALKVLALCMMLLIAISGIVYAACYVHDMTTAVGLIPADVRTATYTTNDFNVRKYYGQGKLILDAKAQGSGITNIVTVQSSALATGATVTWPGDADVNLNTTAGGMTKVAASFTQSGVRQVKYVDLQLKKTGTIASDKVLTLTIEADSSGPTGTPLVTAVTVLANGIDTAYQTVRFTLTTPLALANSTKYWIVLTSNYSASDTNFISWHNYTVASGGGGATYVPSSWTAVATQDPVFTVYQYNFQTAVTFDTVGNTAALQSKAIDLDSEGVALRSVATISGGSSTGAYSLILVAPSRP